MIKKNRDEASESHLSVVNASETIVVCRHLVLQSMILNDRMNQPIVAETQRPEVLQVSQPGVSVLQIKQFLSSRLLFKNLKTKNPPTN